MNADEQIIETIEDFLKQWGDISSIYFSEALGFFVVSVNFQNSVGCIEGFGYTIKEALENWKAAIKLRIEQIKEKA